jgi:hypothetical protein
VTGTGQQTAPLLDSLGMVVVIGVVAPVVVFIFSVLLV